MTAVCTARSQDARQAPSVLTLVPATTNKIGGLEVKVEMPGRAAPRPTHPIQTVHPPTADRGRTGCRSPGSLNWRSRRSSRRPKVEAFVALQHMEDPITRIRVLLAEAAATHHRVYRIVDGNDADWASCYANWLIKLSELPELLGRAPVRSELVYLLVRLDKDFTAQPRDGGGKRSTRVRSCVTSAQRPDKRVISSGGPVLSRTGVRSMMTVTYLSPRRVCRQTCSSTPIIRTPSKRAGSLIRTRRLSARTASLAVFHATDGKYPRTVEDSAILLAWSKTARTPLVGPPRSLGTRLWSSCASSPTTTPA
jgi:hypothetical protein